MPRKVRDANLETRTARARLKVQHKPYFRLIEPGLHIGYRKLASGPGTWVARRYTGDGKYSTDNLRTSDDEIVIADDFADADGARVFSFAQAQQQARARRATPSAGLYTVTDAMADYFDHLASEGKAKHTIYDAKRRSDAFVLPEIGATKIADLTSERLRKWRDGLVKMAPRIRTKTGQEQQHRKKLESDEDAVRARRASANRTWTILRAGLNLAFRNGKADTDAAWRKVKPFKSVDAARVRYLSVAEAKRLINASDADFRLLVQAALQTGCRYGELCALAVADFNPDVGTLTIRRSKAGKPRHVVLTDEGKTFFAELAAGREGDELLLQKGWRASHQNKPMAKAVEKAKINPPISFHGLRHTWASLSVMAGMPLMVVARNLGHSDTRMVEKHYGHLAPGYVSDAVRKSAPKFGFKPGKVVSMPVIKASL